MIKKTGATRNVFDPICLAVPEAAPALEATPEAVQHIKDKNHQGCHRKPSFQSTKKHATVNKQQHVRKLIVLPQEKIIPLD